MLRLLIFDDNSFVLGLSTGERCRVVPFIRFDRARRRVLEVCLSQSKDSPGTDFGGTT